MSQSDVVGQVHDHGVRFYQHDSELVDSVAGWIGSGLAQGHHVVVLATAEHRAGFETAMRAAGHDPQPHLQAGRYRPVDADATLAAFVRDGRFDREACLAVIGELIESAQAGGATVRIFGEMVARLWENGEEAAALELEALWNEMAERMPFSLLCAYSLAALGGADLGQVRRVCELHSDLEPPLSYRHTPWPTPASDGDRHTELFLPVPEAVSGVRRFVTAVLEATHDRDVVLDCALVASELAANAYLHAGDAPFRVTVAVSPERVRIGVEDASATTPSARTATLEEDESGRGVAIIEALSVRWGSDPLPRGKLVWAEVRAQRT